MMDDIEESSSSSESSTDEDNFTSSEDEELLVEDRDKPKNLHYFEETVPQYSDEEFMEHFRVSRNLFQTISEQFETSVYYNYQRGPNGKLTSEQHIIVFLWFIGHEAAGFRDVADRFNIAISTLHTIITKVTMFLSNLANKAITWPSYEEQLEIEEIFRGSGFPGVIGIIDGTHVRIDKPTDDPDSYLNRKHFYSIQCQLVCDHKRQIRDIFVGYPGSVHDSRVLRTSSLYRSLQEKCGHFYLLGDSGYPCLSNLLTPYRDRGNLSARQRNYNLKLASNRYIIEHCNGILKQKWRQLYHLKLRSVRLMIHLIRACCVLHNMALTDEFPEQELNEVQDVNIQGLNDIEDEEAAADDRNGIAVRNRICNLLQI